MPLLNMAAYFPISLYLTSDHGPTSGVISPSSFAEIMGLNLESIYEKSAKSPSA